MCAVNAESFLREEQQIKIIVVGFRVHLWQTYW